MADVVRVISSTSVTIQAPETDSTENQCHKIHLTPWDLKFLKLEMNRKGLLFHTEEKEDTPIIIQHLKNSLSSTLAFFPVLAGRLIITEHQENNTASSFIACNNVGALFVHAAAKNTTVADIVQSEYVPPIVHSFFALNGVSNYKGTSQPLLAVQVTELLDGIFIGFTINHVAADGESLWNFVHSWAEISRGVHKGTQLDKISKLPVLERWFPDGIDPPIPFPLTKEEEKQQASKISNPQPPQPIRIFHFTKEKIAKLKSKANADANTNKMSSLQALLTHLWRCVVRCQRIDQEKETYFALQISVRWRMVPPLPENYFGNAAMSGVVKMKAGELLEGGLGKGGWEMNKMIGLYSDEKVKSHYESWVRTPDIVNMSRMTEAGTSSTCVLVTSSSPRFNVYGVDFGWGKPVAVRSGNANNMNGKVTLFAGAEEGSINIEVSLSHEILEAMGNDTEFMDAVFN